MFLTAFLTGAAETAKGYLDEERKRLIESMDEQFKQHNKEAQEALTKSKEKRKILEERSKVFTALTDQYGLADKLSVGAQLAIISDDKDFEAFRDDMNELARFSEDERNERINIISKGITGKSNIQYDDISLGIDAATQIEDVSKPVVVRRKTVFGLPSNIQQKMLDDYKAENPELFSDKTRQAIPTTTGGYSGMKSVKFSKNEAQKALDNFHVSNLNKNFANFKGQKGGEITFSRGQFGGIDINKGAIDALSGEAAELENAVKLDTAKRVFKQLGIGDNQYMVPTEIVLAVQTNFGNALENVGIDLNTALQTAKDGGRVYIGDIIKGIQEYQDNNPISKLQQKAATRAAVPKDKNVPAGGSDDQPTIEPPGDMTPDILLRQNQI
jgi:hypothetical protein